MGGYFSIISDNLANILVAVVRVIRGGSVAVSHERTGRNLFRWIPNESLKFVV